MPALCAARVFPTERTFVFEGSASSEMTGNTIPIASYKKDVSSVAAVRTVDEAFSGIKTEYSLFPSSNRYESVGAVWISWMPPS